MRNVLRIALARLQCFADVGETLGNVARDLCGLLSRIERVRISPDLCKPLANVRVSQILQEDTKVPAIGELTVRPSRAAEVGVNLEAMADIACNDEGRCGMIGIEQEDVAFGLPSRILHH